MKCPNCNETLPDSSQFCANCGTVFEKSRTVLPPAKMEPPASIKHVFCWLDGDTVKKGLMARPHRGFAIGVVLADQKGNTTTGEGTLKIQLGNIWRATFQIKPGDFVSNTFYGFASTDRTEISAIYRFHDPIINYVSCKLEVWLKKPDGKELYHVQTVTLNVG